MKKIIVVTPTYNEEENVFNAYTAIKELFNKINKYEYKHLFIDNCSTDKTQDIIRKIAKDDKNILAILIDKTMDKIDLHFMQSHNVIRML